jgi:xanthine dehydrogenase accessory factor
MVEQSPYNWARIALAHLDAAAAVALVTILATEGSAPREAGTKMVVWSGGQAGTIGGGNLEHQAADQARRMLATEAAFAIQDYPLGPLLNQCCGGRVRLLLERLDDDSRDWLTQAARRLEANQPFALRTTLGDGRLAKAVAPIPASRDAAAGVTLADAVVPARGAFPAQGQILVERSGPPRPRLLLFGAGHVGLAVARAFEPLPFALSWYDSRPDVAQAGAVDIRTTAELTDLIGRADPGAYILVLTHDHALDYALVTAALASGAFAYLGLIGSKTKKARFLGRLRADGHDEAAVARVVCPIGLPGLKSKAPEVIAVSVAGDLLMRLEVARLAPVSELHLASV